MNPQQIEIMADDKKVIDLNDIPDGMTLKQHINNLEQGKGIIHQIEDNHTLFGPNKELTEEKLMSFLQDIMAIPDAPKPMVMLTGCIEKGIVTQSSVEFNLCNNPDCKTCRNLEDALKEQCK